MEPAPNAMRMMLATMPPYWKSLLMTSFLSCGRLMPPTVQRRKGPRIRGGDGFASVGLAGASSAFPRNEISDLPPEIPAGPRLRSGHGGRGRGHELGGRALARLLRG